MCGVFNLNVSKAKLLEKFELKTADEFTLPIEKALPGMLLPIIASTNPSHLQVCHWGLVPHWSHDIKAGKKMINARAETLFEKPSFSKAILNNRCLVPATGYYEWSNLSGKKLPYLIHLANSELFAMAGIWDTTTHPQTGDEYHSFSIITTNPSEKIAGLHNRMPVLLNSKNQEIWLNEGINQNEIEIMLKPYPSEELAFEVSSISMKRINENQISLF